MSASLVVFIVKTVDGREVWVRAGSAHARLDGGLDVSLDVLPLSGRLVIREMTAADWDKVQP